MRSASGMGAGVATRGRDWNPREISNLVLWARASRAVGLVTGGVQVANQSDLSDSLNDLSQSTSRPTYAQFGGANPAEPVIVYATGASLGLQCANSTHLNWERTQPWTAAMVYIPTSYPANGAYIISKGQPLGGSEPGWGIQCGSATNIRVSLANAVANRLVADATITSQTGIGNLLIVTYDGSSLVAGVAGRRNGSALSFGATVNTLSASILSTRNFQTGGMIPLLGDFDGKIGEVVMYSRVLAAAEISRLEKSMNGFWGLF